MDTQDIDAADSSLNQYNPFSPVRLYTGWLYSTGWLYHTGWLYIDNNAGPSAEFAAPLNLGDLEGHAPTQSLRTGLVTNPISNNGDTVDDRPREGVNADSAVPSSDLFAEMLAHMGPPWPDSVPLKNYSNYFEEAGDGRVDGQYNHQRDAQSLNQTADPFLSMPTHQEAAHAQPPWQLPPYPMERDAGPSASESDAARRRSSITNDGGGDDTSNTGNGTSSARTSISAGSSGDGSVQSDLFYCIFSRAGCRAKGFQTPNDAERHEYSVHIKFKLNRCKYKNCKKTDYRRDNLEKHIETHLLPVDKKALKAWRADNTARRKSAKDANDARPHPDIDDNVRRIKETIAELMEVQWTSARLPRMQCLVAGCDKMFGTDTPGTDNSDGSADRAKQLLDEFLRHYRVKHGVNNPEPDPARWAVFVNWLVAEHLVEEKVGAFTLSGAAQRKTASKGKGKEVDAGHSRNRSRSHHGKSRGQGRSRAKGNKRDNEASGSKSSPRKRPRDERNDRR